MSRIYLCKNVPLAGVERPTVVRVAVRNQTRIVKSLIKPR
jgi:hypothetical protein